MRKNKRVFGYVEVIFNILYLCFLTAAGTLVFLREAGALRFLTGATILLLGGGDSFHLIPRIAAVVTGNETRFERALGFGKLVASITMTIFYLLLWHMGLFLFSSRDAASWSIVVYSLAALRIVLCLLPHNKWFDRFPPVRWGIYRNIPFFLLGAAVAALFGILGGGMPGLRFMWAAIVLSFLFYAPVVAFVNQYPKIGMLMLPKTCAYVWIVFIWMSIL